MLMKSRTQTSGFITLETIAITVVIALVLVVTAAIVLYPQFQTDTSLEPAPVSQRSESDIVNQRLDAKIVNQDSPFAPITTAPGQEEKPTNIRLYEKNKPSFVNGSQEVVDTRFIGEVTSTSSDNGLRITLISHLENSSGAEVVYYYEPSLVNKVTIEGGIDSLKPGLVIDIIEYINYNLPYTEGLQKVIIAPTQ